MNNEPKDPLLLDREYDGIHELDNKLPRWWVWLFWGCNIFAVIYLGYYHVFAKGQLATDGQMRTEYQHEMKIGNELKNVAMMKFESDMTTQTPTDDPVVIARGQSTYANACAPCHRLDGGGLVGPNLCDDYWIHGSSFVDSLKVIWNGVPEKGMVTWKTTLKPSDIHAVASYIYTLRGSNPKNPKQREDLAPVKTGPSEFE